MVANRSLLGCDKISKSSPRQLDLSFRRNGIWIQYSSSVLGVDVNDDYKWTRVTWRPKRCDGPNDRRSIFHAPSEEWLRPKQSSSISETTVKQVGVTCRVVRVGGGDKADIPCLVFSDLAAGFIDNSSRHQAGTPCRAKTFAIQFLLTDYMYSFQIFFPYLVWGVHTNLAQPDNLYRRHEKGGYNYYPSSKKMFCEQTWTLIIRRFKCNLCDGMPVCKYIWDYYNYKIQGEGWNL